MARFTIFGKRLTDAEIAAVTALIEEAGGSDGEIEIVKVIDEPDAESDVILLLGTPAVCADPGLEDALVKAANGARRAIWLWPQEGAPAQLPTPVEKYSYSYISWSADKLRAVAADDDVTCFETAGGEPVPQVPTERNLCVEEKTTAQ